MCSGLGKHLKNNAVVLISGGIDSAACVHYYLDQEFHVRGLFIDYGQVAKDYEEIAASSIGLHYGIEIDKASFSIPHHFGVGEIRGRNAFLVLAALLFYPRLRGIISLGIHAGTQYYDCSEFFIKDIKAILDQYTDGVVRIDVPFLEWDKAMIYTYCKENNIPIHLTYSCEAGMNPPCGKCRSCRDRKALDVC